MAVVAVVSGTTKPDHVVVEAARQADSQGTTVQVLYVLGLSWYSSLETRLSDRFGIPTGIDTIEEICEQRAARIANPVIDEYEAVGLVGRPINEIVQYTRRVDGDCIVIDGEPNWGTGLISLSRDPLQQLQDNDILVVPVY